MHLRFARVTRPDMRTMPFHAVSCASSSSRLNGTVRLRQAIMLVSLPSSSKRSGSTSFSDWLLTDPYPMSCAALDAVAIFEIQRGPVGFPDVVFPDEEAIAGRPKFEDINIQSRSAAWQQFLATLAANP
jgi:hypothetical protein